MWQPCSRQFGRLLDGEWLDMFEPQLQKADYGVDAPGVVRGLLVAAICSTVVGLVGYAWLRPRAAQWASRSIRAGLLFGLSFAAPSASMLWSSRIGKLAMRDRIMAAISWRGDEMVLDVGCGRGLLTIAAAKHLITGKAIGIDIWSQVDQSGNRPQATLANAIVEGVADRVIVESADARELPFPDQTFDLVVSSLVLHNISDRVGRVRAVNEMARVLKPDGRVVIVDVARTGEYFRVLSTRGLPVTVSRPFFLFSPTARMVTAYRPV